MWIWQNPWTYYMSGWSMGNSEELIQSQIWQLAHGKHWGSFPPFFFRDWKGKRLGKEGRNEGRSKPLLIYRFNLQVYFSPILLVPSFPLCTIASLTCVSSQTQLLALPSVLFVSALSRQISSGIRSSNHLYLVLVSNTLQNVSQSFSGDKHC